MDINEAKTLIEKYKSGLLNQDEMHVLEDWYMQLAQFKTLNIEDKELDRNLDEIWKQIDLNTSITSTHKASLLWKRITIAALVLFTIGSALYFYVDNQPSGRLAQQKEFTQTIKPGGNRATLTLANGKIITLDAIGNGTFADQAGVKISKTKNGQLVYSVSDQVEATKSKIPNTNIISTPKGGQYQVILPDGSKVWLNSASSLRYPTHFTGKERRVTLTGEGYFEVSKSYGKNSKTNIPFIVETNKQIVEVLGTHFNINAYSDESSLRTTLIEGTVKVGSGINNVILKPGEQSNLTDSKLNVELVNTDEAVAWKNGLFVFKDADLKATMRTLSRWYDVEVSYQGTIPNHTFSGEIYKSSNLNQVLEILNFYQVHFRLEGKKIIVSKN